VLRALADAGIRSMAQLARWSAAELAALHGVGPKGIRILEAGLASQGLHLRRDERTHPR
jgi:predicted flap endonuclease-1-like 5' DNA nuclease